MWLEGPHDGVLTSLRSALSDSGEVDRIREWTPGTRRAAGDELEARRAGNRRSCGG